MLSLSRLALSLALLASLAAAASAACLRFTKQGHVELGPVFDAAEGTIEFWFNPATTENNEWVLGRAKNKDNQMTFGFGPTSFMYMVKKDGQWAYVTVTKESIQPGRWTHVACVFKPDGATLYLNGIAQKGQASPGYFGLDHLAGGPLFLGQGSDPAERFNGMACMVRLSRGARYDKSFAPSTEPPAADDKTEALWMCNETSGDQVKDSSPAARHGRIVGAVERAADAPSLPDAAGAASGAGALPVALTKSPPAIDGRLDDACWAASAQAVGFMDPATGLPAPRPTVIRALYDAKALYLSAQCFEPNMAGLQAGVSLRDGSIFNDDCLELFLGPKNDRASYFHYAFNALGAYYDGQGTNSAFNSQIQCAAQRLNDRWNLEIAIPFDQLGAAPPSAGALWDFNAAREHRVGASVEFSTWHPLASKSFHRPQDFGRLRFVESLQGPGPHEFANLRPSLLNATFVQASPDGAPAAWSLGPNASRRETAYLSGQFVLASKAPGLLARQECGFRGLGGKRLALAVSASGENDARLGLVLDVEAPSGPAKVQALWNQPVAGSFTTLNATLTLPPGVTLLRGFEIHHLAGGALQVRAASVDDASRPFAEVLEAADAFPAHRLPLGSAAASGGHAWATPLAGGPLRALFIMPGYGRRAPVEMAQRVEMAYDSCWMADSSLMAYGAGDINARLRRDATPYDVIVLAAPSASPALGRVLAENVRQGTGLVVITAEGAGAICPGLDPELPELKPAAQAAVPALSSAPWSLWPVIPVDQIFSGSNGQPSLAKAGAGRIGKGGVIVLSYGGPHINRGLLPRTANNPSELDEWWETGYALLARCVRDVSGRGPAASIAAAAGPGALALTAQAPAAFQGTISVEWRNRLGLVTSQQTAASFAAGQSQVTLPFPPAVASASGVLSARVVLRDSQGKAVDWLAAAFEGKGSVALAAASPFAKTVVHSEQPLAATLRATNSGPTAQEAMLAVEASDAWGRVFDRQNRPLSLAPGATSPLDFTFLPKNALTPWVQVRATLRQGQAILDARAWSVVAPDKWNHVLDDFQVGVNGDYFIRAHTDEVIARWLQSVGVTFTTEGGEFDSGPRLNMPWNKICTIQDPFHFNKGLPVRSPCLSNPAVLKDIGEKAVAAVAKCQASSPVLYSVGDECELARDGSFEVCFCPVCAAAFRQWAATAHGSLDRANAAWGTAFKSWDEAGPITAKEARKRGHYGQWVDFRLFMDDTWINAYLSTKAAVAARFPDVKFTFTNPFELNPFSGSDNYKMAKAEDSLCKYVRTDLVKEYRSFKPGALLLTYCGYLEDEDYCRFFPWWFAFNGGRAMVWWSSLARELPYDLFDGEARHTPRSQALLGAAADLPRGPGRLLAALPPALTQVAVLYSQPSMTVSWIESPMEVGSTPWSEGRMPKLPADNSFGVWYRSVEAFKYLVKEAGLQPCFLAPEQIIAGALKDHRLLILPRAVALSDETIAAIAAFVRDGGAVMADTRAGVYDDHGRFFGKRPAVEALLGVTRLGDGRFPDAQAAKDTEDRVAFERLSGKAGPSGVYISGVGKGRAICLGFTPNATAANARLFRELVQSCGVTPPALLSRGEETPAGYETFAWRDTGVELVGVLRDLKPAVKGSRGGWFGPAFRQATPEKENLTITLPAARHVYDVREKRYIGQVKAFEAGFDPCQARLFALLPYQVQAVEIKSAPASCAAGLALAFTASVATQGAAPGLHVLRVETAGPDGKPRPAYARNLVAPRGTAEIILPLALNDTPGAWTITVTDVATGIAASAKVNVTSPAI